MSKAEYVFGLNANVSGVREIVIDYPGVCVGEFSAVGDCLDGELYSYDDGSFLYVEFREATDRNYLRWFANYDELNRWSLGSGAYLF